MKYDKKKITDFKGEVKRMKSEMSTKSNVVNKNKEINMKYDDNVLEDDMNKSSKFKRNLKEFKNQEESKKEIKDMKIKKASNYESEEIENEVTKEIKDKNIEKNKDKKKIISKVTKDKNIEYIEEEDINEVIEKDKKKIKNKVTKDKNIEYIEEEDINEEIENMLKSKTYNKKNLEQKIELSWMDIKNNFVKLIRQKSMYNRISLLYNKGSISTKYDILITTIVNIIEVSKHEHSKQFIIMLAQSNKKYLVMIIKKIKEVCKDICSSRNGLFVLDELYKMSNRKSRKEIIDKILNKETSENIEDKNLDGKNIEDKNLDGKNIEDKNLDGKNIEDKNLDGENIKENKDDKNIKDDEIFSLIKKLSSKRLWTFEVTHHILLDFLIEYPNETDFIFDLFVRNKQMNLLVRTYKGLEVCIKLLTPSRIPDILRILYNDFINVVNNEYGVIYILKILEMNTEDMKNIIDIYTEKYKEIFIEESSVLPLLYIFNQERKYYPTLFNHLRSKEIINIDKTYLIKKYKGIIKEHLAVFMGSFSYILVYFFCKKDDEIKKEVKKMIKDIPENEYTSKLNKKMIKYRLIK